MSFKAEEALSSICRAGTHFVVLHSGAGFLVIKAMQEKLEDDFQGCVGCAAHRGSVVMVVLAWHLPLKGVKWIHAWHIVSRDIESFYFNPRNSLLQEVFSTRCCMEQEREGGGGLVGGDSMWVAAAKDGSSQCMLNMPVGWQKKKESSQRVWKQPGYSPQS